MAELYTAKHSFALERDGEMVHVQQGDTVEAGHWLLERVADAFTPAVATFAAPQPGNPDELLATASFVTTHARKEVIVREGEAFAADHWAVRRFPMYFAARGAAGRAHSSEGR